MLGHIGARGTAYWNVRLLDHLELGAALEGTVTRLVPFGAFVDIGGVEGLVTMRDLLTFIFGHLSGEIEGQALYEERDENVDFSLPYYTSNQAIVALEGSAAEGATPIADLKGGKIGFSVAGVEEALLGAAVDAALPGWRCTVHADLSGSPRVAQLERERA